MKFPEPSESCVLRYGWIKFSASHNLQSSEKEDSEDCPDWIGLYWEYLWGIVLIFN